MANKNNIFYNSPKNLVFISQNTPVLLAFSGGADSTALLHLLIEDAKESNFVVHAAHFNHGIRGEEAERDATFCENLCKKFNIPFYLGYADIPSLAKENKNSVETEAREQRYAFFEKIMRENNIPILITAHHGEDQVETILLHILRGSGVKGIRGMTSCRPFANDLYLVRPLLNAKKQDIWDYCSAHNIDFVTDSTNTDTNYARNLIRAKITPQMSKIQPNLCDVFARLSQNAEETDDFINSSALDFIESNCKKSIPLNKFNSLHSVLRARVLSILFEEHCNATLERVHVDALIDLCKKQEPHAALSLPNKINATIENDNLIFKFFDGEPKSKKIDHLPFNEGKINIGNGIVINIEKNPTKKANNSLNSICIKCNLIDENTYFRSRQEGDMIFAGKMNKKIKKLLCEKKIPLEIRDALPILVSKNEILWIPSVAVCDKLKTDKIKDGEDYFCITIEFEN